MSAEPAAAQYDTNFGMLLSQVNVGLYGTSVALKMGHGRKIDRPVFDFGTGSLSLGLPSRSSLSLTKLVRDPAKRFLHVAKMDAMLTSADQ